MADYDKLEKSEYTRLIPIDLIDANTWNPNQQDDPTFDRLKTELEEAGRLIDPIQVVPTDNGRYMVIGGEHRYRAAMALGWKKIPGTLLTEDRWKNTDVAKFLTVKLNVLSGKLNPEKMASLYDEMAEKYGEDALQGLFSFTDADQWNKLVKGIHAGLKKSLPKPLADKFEKITKDADASVDLGKIINQLFAEYGETVDQSFMVFTYGGKEHLYVTMTEDTRKAMRKVRGYCKKNNRDINDIIAPLTEVWLKAVQQAAKTDPESDPVSSAIVDDVSF
jgi:hypothetical protein